MDSCPGWGFGDSLGGILDGPYLLPSFPQALPPVTCEPRPQDTNLQPEQGAPGDTHELPGRSTSQPPGAGAQGLGQGTASCLPGPGGSCLLDPHPEALSRFGSSTFAPPAVAAQAARCSSRFSLEESVMNPRRPGSAQGNRLWFRRCPCPSRSKPGFS